MRKWLRRGLWTLVVLTASNLVAVLCSIPLYYQVTGGCFLLASLILLALLTLVLVRPLGRSPRRTWSPRCGFSAC